MCKISHAIHVKRSAEKNRKQRQRARESRSQQPLPNLCMGQQELTTKLISRSGDRDRDGEYAVRIVGKGRANARGRVGGVAAGQPKPERSMHFHFWKFSLFYSYFCWAAAAATAALYLSVAVLVGEIVCNHENLISAQICWHCANVFYERRSQVQEPKSKNFEHCAPLAHPSLNTVHRRCPLKKEKVAPKSQRMKQLQWQRAIDMR